MYGGFDDDFYGQDYDDVFDPFEDDGDEVDCEGPDSGEIWEEYQSQYDDDPDPYAGTYSEE